MARSKKKSAGHSRKYGEGSIQERGPAQYRARICIQGQPHEETFDTPGAAQAWLDDVVRYKRRPDRVAHVKAIRKKTLAWALGMRLAHMHKRPDVNFRNQQRKTSFLLRNFRHLVGKHLYEIDELDIKEFVEARLEDDAENATVNGDLSSISNAFNLARSQFGAIGLVNPIGKTTRLPVANGVIRRVSAEEEAALMRAAALDEATRDVRIGNIVQFAMHTAMRRGEMVRMRWEHVDLQQRTVHLPTTKNGSRRTVPLWPSMCAMLEGMSPMKSGPVWGTVDQIRNAFERVRAAAVAEAQRQGNVDLAASLSTLRFHDFRHEGTSRWIERTGWPDAQIMAITGHKTAAMLARYAHIRVCELAVKLVALEGGNCLRLAARREEPVHLQSDEELPEELRQRAAWKLVSGNAAMLQALVDARPIRDVAKDFGLSDVAIHKACERLGIVKPVRGTWNRRDPALAA